MNQQQRHPTLQLIISQTYELINLLQATPLGPGSQPPYAASLEQLRLLRNYSPGIGLWGLFEEAIAAADQPQDLAQHLGAAAERLTTTISTLLQEAAPALAEQLAPRIAHLERRREELKALWYPKEAEVMAAIDSIFGTPWSAEDAETIKLYLTYTEVHAGRSRPLTLGVNGQGTDLLLCDIVHELLHRNSFAEKPGGLWAKLRLFYFTTGTPQWLGHEITHAIITWAGCTITADLWGCEIDGIYHAFSDEAAEAQVVCLDVMAKLWPGFQAGELKLMAMLQRAVQECSAALVPGTDKS